MTDYNAPLTDNDALKYIEKRLGYGLKALLSFPKFFLLETINVCNARCIMCGIDFDNKKKAVMTDELFEKIASEISSYNNHVEKVLLYLDCEPLLDKKLASRIKRFKEGGIKTINLASNASLLDEKKATYLIEAGLDEIYITIDSLKKEVFETIRPGLKFEDVYNNTVNFTKLRNRLKPELMVRVQMVMQELNYKEADSFMEHWNSILMPHDKVVVTKAHNWGSTVEVMKFGDEDDANSIPCIALWGTMAIHVDGKTGLCCMDTNSSFLIGDINNNTIAEIWNGDRITQIRKMHTAGKRADIPLCDGCTLWRQTKHDRERIKEPA